ncbi:RidA family protein [Brooklawnia cerclae]|uniref:Enamine deaminase RidA (YjgF/YER057c/UK114 family) n=1 Tax=Brooklawnia cerclae TaxID=349934 RepID=A0ABX0SAX5_9ACTN|nr:enamine deaminase RidA (YjgF/YER057c/UK114 family) [Brooklawnia cerclae]
MSASERLAALGIELPPVVTPIGAYVPAKASAGQVLTSGQLPIDAVGQLVAGRLGEDLEVADGQRAARIAVLNALAAAASVAGGLDAVHEVVRVMVFVNSAPGFTDQALVANGASELLGEVFGDAGRHVRSAVGVAALPKNAAVEVELVVGV